MDRRQGLGIALEDRRRHSEGGLTVDVAGLRLTTNQLQFLEALKRVPMHKILTIKDLENLDNEALKAVIEAENPLKLDNEAA